MDRVLADGAMNPADPFDAKTMIKGTERVLCLDASTGKEIWKHEYDCPYKISYPAGPRCTATVLGGKVYSLGAMGDLYCLDAKKGTVVWSKNFAKDYGAKTATWGYAGHPLVDDNRLVCVVGGEGSLVVAFDKDTGKELWKSGTAPEQGYSAPTIITAGGKRQLIVWDGGKVGSLDPEKGTAYWDVDHDSAADRRQVVRRRNGRKQGVEADERRRQGRSRGVVAGQCEIGHRAG
jgi:outer membrane protein assembly factor BamB